MTRVPSNESLLSVAVRLAEAALSALGVRRRGRLPEARGIPVEPGEIDRLTLRDVVAWSATHRPDDERVVTAAVLRESRRGGGLRVTTVFLDGADELVRDAEQRPFGRAQHVRALDAELETFFGDCDLVVLR